MAVLVGCATLFSKPDPITGKSSSNISQPSRSIPQLLGSTYSVPTNYVAYYKEILATPELRIKNTSIQSASCPKHPVKWDAPTRGWLMICAYNHTL